MSGHYRAKEKIGLIKIACHLEDFAICLVFSIVLIVGGLALAVTGFGLGFLAVAYGLLVAYLITWLIYQDSRELRRMMDEKRPPITERSSE
mgnify:CR=1 FL=1